MPTGLRKCRWCGAAVSREAAACPSCKRGLTSWPIRNLTADCDSCRTPLLLHTMWKRVDQGATGYSISMSGNTGTITPTGGGSWAAPLRCPKCADPDPLRSARRKFTRSPMFWFGILWPVALFQYLVFLVRTRPVVARPDNPTIAALLLAAYAVPVALFLFTHWRRHAARQRVFRHSREVAPKELKIRGYDLWAVTKMLRSRIKKGQPLVVSVSAAEATRPA